jgi:hypothetical protein
MIFANGESCGGDFVNHVNALLLPFNLMYDNIQRIESQCTKPTLVVYDKMGRIRSMILSSCNYLILEKMWTPVQLLNTNVTITGIEHEKNTLISNISMFDKLLLPPNRPDDFKKWQPQGDYAVLHDADGRIFSITRDGTNIQLAALWEYRYNETYNTPSNDIEMS